MLLGLLILSFQNFDKIKFAMIKIQNHDTRSIDSIKPTTNKLEGPPDVPEILTILYNEISPLFRAST